MARYVYFLRHGATGNWTIGEYNLHPEEKRVDLTILGYADPVSPTLFSHHIPITVPDRLLDPVQAKTECDACTLFSATTQNQNLVDTIAGGASEYLPQTACKMFGDMLLCPKETLDGANYKPSDKVVNFMQKMCQEWVDFWYTRDDIQ